MPSTNPSLRSARVERSIIGSPGACSRTLSASRALLSYCRRSGLDTARIIEDAGAPPALNTNVDLALPFETRLALWRTASAAARDPYLHLRVAEQAPFGTFRISDFVCATAPSLVVALRKLAQLFQAVELGTSLRYVEDAECVQLSAEPAGDDDEMREQRIEYLLATCYVRARLATRTAFTPLQLELAAPAPQDARPIEQTFRCPVRFAATCNRLWFRRRDLERQNEREDPHVLELLEASIAAQAQTGDAADRVRLALEQLVLQQVRLAPEIDGVARKLGMSARTLQRRLRASGTSFSDILDETRQRQACRLLSARDRPLLAVAQELGFSEQSAFTRAFKRWSGVSPTQLRCVLRAS